MAIERLRQPLMLALCGLAGVVVSPALLAQGGTTVNEDAGSATVTVSLTNPCADACSIDFNTVDGSASAGSDYTATNGQLTWNSGESAPRSITVAILDDTDPEATESFRIEFSNGVGVDKFPSDATITIVDNDAGNQPPTAVDDSAVTQAGTAVTVAVLANDSDPDSGPESLNIFEVNSPKNGSVQVNFADGSVTYTPNPGFTGTDSFGYSITDGADTAGATISITVQAGNQPPTAVDDSATTTLNGTVVIPVLANDSDPDGGPSPLSVVSVDTAGTDGVVTINTDNTVSYSAPTGNALVDSFGYTISDGVASASARVTVTVTGTPPPVTGTPPPVARDDAFTVTAGRTATFDVLANDSGGSISPGLHATLRILTVSPVSPADAGTVAINAGGTALVFQPPSTVTSTRTATFSYSISDGVNSATALVTVTVEPAGDEPDPPPPPPPPDNTAPDGTISAPANDVTIDAGETVEFAGMGTDADGDTVTFRWQFPGGEPSTSSEQNPGAVRYAAAGTFTATLTVTDANGAADPTPATRTVTVRALPAVSEGTRLQSQSPAEQVLALNQTGELAVRVVDAGGAPLGGVPVLWSLRSISEVDVPGGELSAERVLTDADGRASNQVTTGGLPEAYEVTATLADGSSPVTFLVRVGTEGNPEVSANTPEAAAGRAVDAVCPPLATAPAGSLSEDQQDLRDRCTAVIVADGMGNDTGADNALREISPAEASVSGRTGELMAAQQVGNISSRLFALRRGDQALSLAGLNITIDGQVLSGATLQQLFGAGGGAGDDDGGELSEVSDTGRLGVFVTGTLNLGERDSTDEEQGFDFDTLGLTAGVDYRFSDQLVLGAALGYANTDADIDSDGGSFDADSLSLSVYGNFYVNDNLYIDAILSVGRNDYELDRTIRYQLSEDPVESGRVVDRTARADTDSSQFGLSVGAGYQFNFDNGLALVVDGRLNHVSADVDGYTERGAGGLNLTVGDQEWESLTLTLGGEVSKAFSYDWGVLIPRARLEFEHEFDNDAEQIEFRFANALNQEQNFSFEVSEPDSNYFRLGGGVAAVFTQGRSAFFNAETVLGKDDETDYTINLGARWEF